MDYLTASWRTGALMIFCGLLALWTIAGFLAVIFFAAAAELCLQAVAAHQRRDGTQPDREG